VIAHEAAARPRGWEAAPRGAVNPQAAMRHLPGPLCFDSATRPARFWNQTSAQARQKRAAPSPFALASPLEAAPGFEADARAKAEGARGKPLENGYQGDQSEAVKQTADNLIIAGFFCATAPRREQHINWDLQGWTISFP
jgi:hypothetical protein